MPRKLKKILAFVLCFLLIFEQTGFAQVAGQLDISGYFTGLRNSFTQDKFRPLHLRYLAYDNLNNNFKLLLDKGDFKLNELNGQNGLNEQTKKLLNYFFVGISLPNDSFWVNLRPDSPDNIIDDFLAQTDVGKILLEADLQLKKDTASMTSPQTPEGKKYWDKLYKKAEELLGYENVTIPTLVRPWIVPGEIIIRESQDNAYIYKATLKVMLEEDYLSGNSGQGSVFSVYEFKDPRLKALNTYSSQLLKELIIPKLTREVNTAKRYAALRQVYYSLILAQWFKARFYGKGGLYSWLIDKKNLTGLLSKDSWSKTQYFKAYQKNFQDGQYNLKEPIQTPFGQSMRSYFSGGVALDLSIGTTAGNAASPVQFMQGNLGRDILNIASSPMSPKITIQFQGGTQDDPAGVTAMQVVPAPIANSELPMRRILIQPHYRNFEGQFPDQDPHNEQKIVEFVSGMDGIASGQKLCLMSLLLSYERNNLHGTVGQGILSIRFVPEGQFFEFLTRDKQYRVVSLGRLWQDFGFSDFSTEDFADMSTIKISNNPDRPLAIPKLVALVVTAIRHPERVRVVSQFMQGKVWLRVYNVDVSNVPSPQGLPITAELIRDDFLLSDTEIALVTAGKIVHELVRADGVLIDGYTEYLENSIGRGILPRLKALLVATAKRRLQNPDSLFFSDGIDETILEARRHLRVMNQDEIQAYIAQLEQLIQFSTKGLHSARRLCRLYNHFASFNFKSLYLDSEGKLEEFRGTPTEALRKANTALESLIKHTQLIKTMSDSSRPSPQGEGPVQASSPAEGSNEHDISLAIDSLLTEWFSSRFEQLPDRLKLEFKQRDLAKFISENFPQAEFNFKHYQDSGSSFGKFYNRYSSDRDSARKALLRLWQIYTKYLPLLTELNERMKVRLGRADVQFAGLMFSFEGMTNPMRNNYGRPLEAMQLVLNTEYLFDERNDTFDIGDIAHEAGHGLVPFMVNRYYPQGFEESVEMAANWAAAQLLSREEIQDFLRRQVQVRLQISSQTGRDSIYYLSASHLLAFARKIGISNDTVTILERYHSPAAVDQFTRFYDTLEWATPASSPVSQRSFLKQVAAGIGALTLVFIMALPVSAANMVTSATSYQDLVTYMANMTQEERDIYKLISEWTGGIPIEYLYALEWRESSGRDDARSPKVGAVGPFQITRSNVKILNDWVEKREKLIKAGKKLSPSDEVQYRLIIEIKKIIGPGKLLFERCITDPIYNRAVGAMTLAEHFYKLYRFKLVKKKTGSGWQFVPRKRGEKPGHAIKRATFAMFNWGRVETVLQLIRRHGPVRWINYIPKPTKQYIEDIDKIAVVIASIEKKRGSSSPILPENQEAASASSPAQSARQQEVPRDIGHVVRASENGLVFVHGFLESTLPPPTAALRPYASWKTKLKVLLSFRPTISASSIERGDTIDNFWGNFGVVLSGGRIEDAGPRDTGSIAKTIGKRDSARNNGDADIVAKMEKAIKERIDVGRFRYNEFIISNPQVAGFFFIVDEDGLTADGKIELEWHINSIKRIYDYVKSEFPAMPIFVFKRGVFYEVSDFDAETGQFTTDTDPIDPKEILNRRFLLEDGARDRLKAELMEDNPFRMRLLEESCVSARDWGQLSYMEINSGAFIAPTGEDGRSCPYEEMPAESRTNQLNPKEPIVPIAEFYMLKGPGYGRRNKIQLFTQNNKMFRRTIVQDEDDPNPNCTVEVIERTGTYNAITSSYDNGLVRLDYQLNHKGNGAIRTTQDYVRTMEEGIQNWLSYRDDAAVKKDEKSRLYYDTLIQQALFHLYGFGEQAGLLGDAEGKRMAFEMLDKLGLLSEAKIKEVLIRRVGPEGKFRIFDSDIDTPLLPSTIYARSPAQSASPVDEAASSAVQGERKRIKGLSTSASVTSRRSFVRGVLGGVLVMWALASIGPLRALTAAVDTDKTLSSGATAIAGGENVKHIGGSEWCLVPGRVNGDYQPSNKNSLFQPMNNAKGGVTGGFGNELTPGDITYRLGTITDQTDVQDIDNLLRQYQGKIQQDPGLLLTLRAIMKDRLIFIALRVFLREGGRIVSWSSSGRYNHVTRAVSIGVDKDELESQRGAFHETTHFINDKIDSVLWESESTDGADHFLTTPLVERYFMIRLILKGQLPLHRLVDSLYGHTTRGKLGEKIEALIKQRDLKGIEDLLGSDETCLNYVHSGMVHPLSSVEYTTSVRHFTLELPNNQTIRVREDKKTASADTVKIENYSGRIYIEVATKDIKKFAIDKLFATGAIPKRDEDRVKDFIEAYRQDHNKSRDYILTPEQIQDLAHIYAYNANIFLGSLRLAIVLSRKYGNAVEEAYRSQEYQKLFLQFLKEFSSRVQRNPRGGLRKTANEAIEDLLKASGYGSLSSPTGQYSSTSSPILPENQKAPPASPVNAAASSAIIESSEISAPDINQSLLEQFNKKLLSLSDSKDLDSARREWELYAIEYLDPAGKCCFNHNIRWRLTFRNKKTGNIIGDLGPEEVIDTLKLTTKKQIEDFKQETEAWNQHLRMINRFQQFLTSNQAGQLQQLNSRTFLTKNDAPVITELYTSLLPTIDEYRQVMEVLKILDMPSLKKRYLLVGEEDILQGLRQRLSEQVISEPIRDREEEIISNVRKKLEATQASLSHSRLFWARRTKHKAGAPALSDEIFDVESASLANQYLAHMYSTLIRAGGRRVIDFGAGRSGFYTKLAAYGGVPHTSLVLDVDLEESEIWEGANPHKVIIDGNGNTLVASHPEFESSHYNARESESTYDLIIANFVLDQLTSEQIKNFFGMAFRLLKAGGELAISLPRTKFPTKSLLDALKKMGWVIVHNSEQRTSLTDTKYKQVQDEEGEEVAEDLKHLAERTFHMLIVKKAENMAKVSPIDLDATPFTLNSPKIKKGGSQIAIAFQLNLPHINAIHLLADGLGPDDIRVANGHYIDRETLQAEHPSIGDKVFELATVISLLPKRKQREASNIICAWYDLEREYLPSSFLAEIKSLLNELPAAIPVTTIASKLPQVEDWIKVAMITEPTVRFQYERFSGRQRGEKFSIFELAELKRRYLVTRWLGEQRADIEQAVRHSQLTPGQTFYLRTYYKEETVATIARIPGAQSKGVVYKHFRTWMKESPEFQDAIVVIREDLEKRQAQREEDLKVKSIRLYEQHRGNLSKVAMQLGLSSETLRLRFKKWQQSDPAFSDKIREIDIQISTTFTEEEQRYIDLYRKHRGVYVDIAKELGIWASSVRVSIITRRSNNPAFRRLLDQIDEEIAGSLTPDQERYLELLRKHNGSVSLVAKELRRVRHHIHTQLKTWRETSPLFKKAWDEVQAQRTPLTSLQEDYLRLYEQGGSQRAIAQALSVPDSAVTQNLKSWLKKNPVFAERWEEIKAKLIEQERQEQDKILQALQRHHGRIKATASELTMEPNTLASRIKRLRETDTEFAKKYSELNSLIQQTLSEEQVLFLQLYPAHNKINQDLAASFGISSWQLTAKVTHWIRTNKRFKDEYYRLKGEARVSSSAQSASPVNAAASSSATTALADEPAKGSVAGSPAEEPDVRKQQHVLQKGQEVVYNDLRYIVWSIEEVTVMDQRMPKITLRSTTDPNVSVGIIGPGIENIVPVGRAKIQQKQQYWQAESLTPRQNAEVIALLKDMLKGENDEIEYLDNSFSFRVAAGLLGYITPDYIDEALGLDAVHLLTKEEIRQFLSLRKTVAFKMLSDSLFKSLELDEGLRGFRRGLKTHQNLTELGRWIERQEKIINVAYSQEPSLSKYNAWREWIKRVMEADQAEVATRIQELQNMVNTNEIRQVLESVSAEDLELEIWAWMWNAQAWHPQGSVVAVDRKWVEYFLGYGALAIKSVNEIFAGETDRREIWSAVVDLIKESTKIDPASLLVAKTERDHIKFAYLVTFGFMPDLDKIDILYHGSSLENIRRMIFESGGYIDAAQSGDPKKRLDNYFSFLRYISQDFAIEGGFVLEFDVRELLRAGMHFRLGPSVSEAELVSEKPVPLKALTFASKREVVNRFLSADATANEILAKALGYESFAELQQALDEPKFAGSPAAEGQPEKIILSSQDIIEIFQLRLAFRNLQNAIATFKAAQENQQSLDELIASAKSLSQVIDSRQNKNLSLLYRAFRALDEDAEINLDFPNLIEVIFGFEDSEHEKQRRELESIEVALKTAITIINYVIRTKGFPVKDMTVDTPLGPEPGKSLDIKVVMKEINKIASSAVDSPAQAVIKALKDLHSRHKGSKVPATLSEVADAIAKALGMQVGYEGEKTEAVLFKNIIIRPENQEPALKGHMQEFGRLYPHRIESLKQLISQRPEILRAIGFVSYSEEERATVILTFGRIEDLVNFNPASSPIQRFEDGKGSIDASLRSASTPGRNGELAGVDFRALPIVTQPIMPSLGTVPYSSQGPSFRSGSNFGKGSTRNLRQSPSNINLEAEWKQIRNMLNAGIIPSSERIKDYLAGCCQNGNFEKNIEKVLAGIADILRLEEERVESTEPALKQVLVLLESDKSGEELQRELINITISPKEPAIRH